MAQAAGKSTHDGQIVVAEERPRLEGTRLVDDLGCAADEHLQLPVRLGRPARARAVRHRSCRVAAVRMAGARAVEEGHVRPYRSRYEVGQHAVRGQAYRVGFPNGEAGGVARLSRL